MPEVGTRVRMPWEAGTRDGVVTQQLGAGTQMQRVKIRPDGETAEVDYKIDQIDLAPEDSATAD